MPEFSRQTRPHGFALVVASALVLAGCPGRTPPSNEGGKNRDGSSYGNAGWSDELFDYAIDTMLNRTEEFSGNEMQLQTTSRLNQWMQKQAPIADWQPDPMLAGMSDEFSRVGQALVELATPLDELNQSTEEGVRDATLRSAAAELQRSAEQCSSLVARMPLSDVAAIAANLSRLAQQLEQVRKDLAGADEAAKKKAQTFLSKFQPDGIAVLGKQMSAFAERLNVNKLEFSAADGRSFQEIVWLRRVSQWASGGEHADPLKQSQQLFDWTVRNIQVQTQIVHRMPQRQLPIQQAVWETLMFGRGTPVDRAWVFILLARQQNIEAALLAVPNPDDPQSGRLRLWAVGVLIDSEIYLFDPLRGTIVPAVDGVTLDKDQLSIRPATLTEATVDSRVLEQMCSGDERPYPVQASDLTRVTALIEAGPTYLSQRMALIESRLSGEDRLVLTFAASQQAERFRQHESIAEAQIWGRPFQVLMHEILLGGERMVWQQIMMVPFGAGTAAVPTLYKGRVYHLKGVFTGDPSATHFYRMARQSDFQFHSANLDRVTEAAFKRAKMDATYWLGLVVAIGGNHRAAIDYLENHTLDASFGGPWETGATYNLARIYEAQGDFDRAIELYRSNERAPDYHGQLLRADWLSSLTSSSAPAEDEGKGQTEADADQPSEEKAGDGEGVEPASEDDGQVQAPPESVPASNESS